MFRVVVACVLLAAATPRASLAQPVVQPEVDTPLAKPGTRSRELAIDVPGERSTENKLVIGGVLATGVIASALGLYWHLDSRDAAAAVSADEFTGEAWTPAHVADVERADRSKTRATIAYSIGGAFVIGAIVAYIVTEPKSETAIIRTGVVVAPTSSGGGVVAKAWSF